MSVFMWGLISQGNKTRLGDGGKGARQMEGKNW